MRFKPTAEERAIVDFLAQIWPAGAGYQLDGETDHEMQKHGSRLLDADAIVRTEEAAHSPDGSDTVHAAVYRINDELMAAAGATRHPEFN